MCDIDTRKDRKERRIIDEKKQEIEKKGSKVKIAKKEEIEENAKINK